MKLHEFTIIATGLDPMEEGFDDRLFEAGCDDATISIQKGAIVLDFGREARSFLSAVESAIQDVARAGATVVHVEPDHLVSLSDIASRAGVTRAAASHYASGARGQGFPPPIARVTTDHPIWDWVEVARWLFRNGRLSRTEVTRARVVQRVNAEISAEGKGRAKALTSKARNNHDCVHA
jgi:hypothetical protein